VVGGQFWTAEAARTAMELGADVVERDPRALVALLRERVPPRSA
jgi:NADPH-dependent 2,4-dienoyl-CoA reductase/sulfur reductase-like enzyme